MKYMLLQVACYVHINNNQINVVYYSLQSAYT